MARQRGLEEFLPVYESRRKWSDRIKALEIPLFPGYVFCRIDPLKSLPLLTIPGVVHMVSIARTPVPIDDAEITALQAASVSGLPLEPWPFLKIGDRAKLVGGPLEGLEGLVIRERKECRLVLAVSLLNRAVAVEIERDWILPLGESGEAAKPIGYRTFRSEKPALS